MASKLLTMLVIIVSSSYLSSILSETTVHIEFSSISAAPAILPGADEPSPNSPADILPIMPTPKAGATSPSPSDQPTTIPSSPSPPNPDFFLPPGPEPDVAFPPSGFFSAASRASSASASLFAPSMNFVLFPIGVLVFCFKQLFAV